MFLGWEKTSRQWVLMEGGAPQTQGRAILMCSCTSMEQAPMKHERNSSSCVPEWQRWASLWQGQPTCVLLVLGAPSQHRACSGASISVWVLRALSLTCIQGLRPAEPGIILVASVCPALCPPVPSGGPTCGHSVWTCRLINWILINPSLKAWNVLQEVFFEEHFFDNVAPRNVRSHTV